jgi:hypothetical protein
MCFNLAAFDLLGTLYALWRVAFAFAGKIIDYQYGYLKILDFGYIYLSYGQTF